MAQTPRPPDFLNARRLIGSLLGVAGIALALWDAADPAYEVSPVIVALMIAGALAMFGLGSFSFPFGGGGK